MQRFNFSIIAALSTVFLLSSCLPAAIVGTGMATKVAMEDRSAGSAVDDTTIANRIRAEMFKRDADRLFHKVSVKVREGRVMLNGTVNTPQDRVEAVRMAWEQPGVTEVINEIGISNGEKEGAAAIPRVGKDTWITTQIKTKLFFDKDIKSVNYTVDTIHGVVYIMGIAQDQHELDKVLDVARNVEKVQKVVSHVRLKDSPKRPHHEAPVDSTVD